MGTHSWTALQGTCYVPIDLNQKPATLRVARRHAGVLEFARVIPEPELSLLVQDFTDAYNELRFGADVDAAARMMSLMEQLGTRR